VAAPAIKLERWWSGTGDDYGRPGVAVILAAVLGVVFIIRKGLTGAGLVFVAWLFAWLALTALGVLTPLTLRANLAVPPALIALSAIAIGTIVTINAVIGFLQEHRAERAVRALRSMTAPRARVVRDGHSVMMPANAIVPGDVLVLEAGDVAAADARLRIAHALTTNEASLTGESTPVDKATSPTGPDTPLAERHDFVFMGTSVATGTGLAEVVATGMRTELGRIAHLLSTAEETVTPLQRPADPPSTVGPAPAANAAGTFRAALLSPRL